ncbi:LysR family transcriptional regulator [Oleiphilus sp. HI0009]|uniref:LysR family transcriptional regulator n=1 Tax=unclassified Oleiphilus TaxID=2631174 RepID=UPI0007C37C9C|nr:MULTISPECIES: LysR family transcriptional regulator [unclassified Oleiphilus]KZX76652.1 LysR family transcriptional regulator [Oleiphilus sp. HI0009]KZY65324.1 LysR family transcriptional regulator [Oleiphilus sp. HI0066]KZY68456.1 LysR family transcriptional regulator [Oleiphilus sp. HI0067]MCH2158921.1 LysR family transcriptional regulator [Oleiphilaceae bacterium]
MIERTHLRILHAVEQNGSLTAAAKALCVTQSALSHTMRKLEDNLGAEIWFREGRSLRLTQSGRYLLNIANRVLPLLDHAEEKLKQMAQGERGTLRIGMECHPCYQWLLKIVSPFLDAWPDVDVDVKQKFQFGGVGALLDYEIDLLVTPDPFYKSGLNFTPVFDYEQVLVVPRGHDLVGCQYAEAEDLRDQVLLTYPVATDRLDIYSQFLNPAGVVPRLHKTSETTEIMLQMVACGRGVAALPRWLAEEYCKKLPLSVVRLGREGIAKQIFVGTRESDGDIKYLNAFIEMARGYEYPISTGKT